MKLGLITSGIFIAAALALSACGPKAGETSTSTTTTTTSTNGGGAFGGMFPTKQAAYKATYQLGEDSSRVMTIYSSGDGKMRTEASMGKGMTPVSLIDRDNKQFLSYVEGPGAPKRATKLSADSIKQFEDMMPSGDAAAMAKPTKIGSDSVAGLSCNIWQLPAPPEGVAPAPADPAAAAGDRTLCLTDDGIMLRAGAKEKPRLLATSVNKGPQDAALFVLPAGYEIIDMGDCMKIIADVAAAYKSGQKPDMAKMLECQKKMGGLGAP